MQSFEIESSDVTVSSLGSSSDDASRRSEQSHTETASRADAHFEPLPARSPKTFSGVREPKPQHAERGHAHPERSHGGKAHHPRTLAPAAESHSSEAGAAQGGATPSGVTFAQIGLAGPILQAVTDEGYSTPTPIQGASIPPALDGKDILGCAQTGTGKTAAFALPILHRLLKGPRDTSRRGPVHPRALILSPTRELASQIGESFETYGRYTGLTQTTIFGGVSQFHQVRALHRGVDILVATPGRLIDLMQQRLVDLNSVEVFVLDEADRMLDMGFIQPIRRIAASVPKQRQTLLFSATMPREIVHLAEALLREPVRVSVNPVASAAPLIEQSVYMIERSLKPALLQHLFDDAAVKKALVFTRTKRGADVVTRRLDKAGIPAVAIHGNKAQNQRTRALDSFRSGAARVLVATDVAARGIDIDNVTHVINYDIPNEPEAYVHRIGRTGRAGAKGLAIAMCDHEEREYLRDIERLTKTKIPVAAPITDLPDLPAHSAEHSHRAHGESHPHRGTRGHSRAGGGERESRHGGHGHHPRSHAGGGHQSRDRQGGGGGGSGGGGHSAAAHDNLPQHAQKSKKKPFHRGQGPKTGGGGHPLGDGHRTGGHSKAAPRTMNHFRGKVKRPGGR